MTDEVSLRVEALSKAKGQAKQSPLGSAKPGRPRILHEYTDENLCRVNRRGALQRTPEGRVAARPYWPTSKTERLAAGQELAEAEGGCVS